LSSPPVARGDERPTHPMGRAVPKRGSFGLAPDGVCPAPDVTTGTVSSYLAISPLLPGKAGPFPEGGVFSVALSPGLPESPLATILPFGVRTFLPFVPGVG
jgi:hypothetical protein